MKLRFTSATCPECETIFDRVPVEYDEDGGYAVLEIHPCAHTECGKLLCACCDQFHCDGCGETFCADHLVSVPDGTDNPLHCCPACAGECEVNYLAAPMPNQSELQPFAPAEAA
jgi:hypothetical protein